MAQTTQVKVNKTERAKNALYGAAFLWERPTIHDAYIAVELKAGRMENLQAGLRQTLCEQGLECEAAAPSIHVSIAYVQGAASAESVSCAAEEIAKEGFHVVGSEFAILEGRSTDYDYLVLKLEASKDFENAQGVVAGQKIQTKKFEEGFQSHVSLLRFKKGHYFRSGLEQLVRELNASQGAAFALGRKLEMDGECVCVFNPARQRCLQIHFRNSRTYVA